MQVEQSFTVAHPRARVWAFFGRIEEVAQCMPGGTLTAPVEDGRVKGKIDVKLGPMGAQFAGEGEVERDDAAWQGVIRGSGRDNRTGSRVKGEVTYALAEPEPGRTQVEIRVDFSLSGQLAQFSRPGIVNDLAARMTEAFARNVEARLAAETGARETAGAGPDVGKADPRAPEAPEAAPLNLGGLLLSVLWARIRGVFARLLGRR